MASPASSTGPRDAAGHPAELYEHRIGIIDRNVAQQYRKYDIGAQPGFEGNVRVEVYSAITKTEAVFVGGGAGVRAHGQLRVETAGRYFVVVRDVANVPTSYTVRVTQN